MNNFKIKVINYIFWIVLLILSLYMTDLYLRLNFSYDGESYYKGAGHLLREDFWKAIFFIVAQQLLISTILFYLIFISVNGLMRKWIFKSLIIIWSLIIGLVLIYAGIKIYDLYNSDFSNKERIIEIVLTWIVRLTGFVIGYIFAINNVGLMLNRLKK